MTPDDAAPAEVRLVGHLRAAGLAVTQTGLKGFIAGVAAAPEAAGEAWLALLEPVLPADLRAWLQSRLAAVRYLDPGASGDRSGRVMAMRQLLKAESLDGFLVPRADEHQGEYVPLRAQRLAWLTGFTGSAGLAAVLATRAALFVDGRYSLQARSEASPELFEVRHLMDEPPSRWLIEALPDGGRLGFDPRLHTVEWVERMRAALDPAGVALVACPDNPVDRIWNDRPPPPLAPVVAHGTGYAGRTSAEKRVALAADLGRRRVDAAALTQPDSIAWLLNIRGGDVRHTPLPLSFAILHADGSVALFIDRRKLAPGTAAALGDQVTVEPVEAFGVALAELGREGRRVLVDPMTASAWTLDRVQAAGARILRDDDPCLLPKACKNEVELAGSRAAHLRDGVAMVRFLSWLDAAAGEGTLTEIEAAERLLDCRRAEDRFRDLSFETISAAGPNGAIVHYRVTRQSSRRLEPGSLYLIDSGGQYLDGTTDVTRTVAIGTPTEEMRRRFTLVLKAHIAIATARFPKGTTGSQLDPLARRTLWDEGFDYDHGTGHGVGSYLSVHEGPQRIAKMPSKVALAAGMILSNEPGYYKADAYGIRIENLVAVRPCNDLPQAERPMLAFETLTLVPIDRRLILAEILSTAERTWVDAYHATVRKALLPRLPPDERAWLDAATAPLAGG